MSTPVYNQQPTVGNRPCAVKDAQGNVIADSFDWLAFQGDYTGTNLIYKGFARPGADTADPVWQISQQAYDGSNNLVSIKWPQNGTGAANNDFQFAWDDRASYTYS